ncbi:hypothetical protein AKJ09_07668 [Labilithrix luteola]|uniref:Lipoprotein n=1 Tax=Labilithrix luteola TaxID=1391654 RepID=A0A0K1Q6G1_9BACT|nr:hypothetical protein [Labilithrix luteola]AKV01005.1 hypothetical protein AKJ09_07668 [Labilithrix luteola]
MNSRMHLIARLALVLTLALSAGCQKKETRWDEASAAAKSAATNDVPAPAKTDGSKLNAFFPADGAGGYARVFTQEKAGFVEAKLQKDGAAVATLSISDTEGDAAAKQKFDGATDKVGGAPLVAVGKNQSAALVGRYQIKVSSQSLDADARKGLLEKFDLKGLAKL